MFADTSERRFDTSFQFLLGNQASPDRSQRGLQRQRRKGEALTADSNCLLLI